MQSVARRLLAAGIVFAIACGGARATSNQSEPPSFQLGDSVTMPTRTVNAGISSTVAFYLPEKDLLPESVAFDEKDGSFYVGSMRKGKIVRVDAKGNASDFIAPRQDGLWEVIGIKVHPTRRMLWVCSFDGPELEGHKKSDTNATGIFQYNLDTGKLIRKWVLDKPGEVHGFNDVALTRGNDAYITHMMKEPAIYRITQAGQKLEIFAKPEGLEYPNGITLSADEKTLFVAGSDGVFVIDVASGKSRRLIPAEGDDMKALDGLYFYRGNLLAVGVESVNLYHLDESSARVVMADVVEQHHPLMNIPTTGVLVGDDFYYVANSQLNMLNPDGSLATEKLTEPPILKLKLR